MALLELSLPDSPPDFGALSVRHFEVHEGLSTLFEVALVVLSPSPDLDLDQIVGKRARFAVSGGDLGSRSWAGVCFGAELLAVEEGALSTYRVSIAPALWLLTQRVNHRIFQHLSAPEIVAALCREWNLPVELRLDLEVFPRLEYRVQYGESDFAFLSRMLEEAGISYFFEPEGEGDAAASRLVLSDAPELAEPTLDPLRYLDNPGERLRGPWVTAVTLSTDVRPGRIAMVDYDPRRPQYRLTYRFEAPGSGEEALEHYVYAPGSGRIDLAQQAEMREMPTNTPVGDDQSFARIDEHEGYALAARKLRGARHDRRHISFSSNVIGLAPGMAVRLSGHPKPQLASDRKLVIAGLDLQGSSHGEWSIGAVAAFADEPIRPALKTPRPRIAGPQSAIVVGPPGEEIYADESGRVRVRFHWDRATGPDHQRTSWVRVNEGWSGAGWGMVAIPRVGHEVIVDFYEGNPDEPVIIGRVYNGAAPPPYALPAHRTKSVWRTQSTPGSSGYHEISFEDGAGHEEIFIRSERDLHKVVKNEETEATRRDRSMVVGEDLSVSVKEEDAITAGAGHSVSMGRVSGAERVAEMGDPLVAEGATKREIIPGRITVTTGGATIQLDGPDIIITAESSISLKAGKEVKILGGPYVHVNPPALVAKTGDQDRASVPEQEVWFKLLSDDGAPMPDVTCHVEHDDGSLSVARKSDGRGMVRFPVEKSGNYHLVVGTPPKPEEPAAKPAAPAAAQSAPAPSSGPPAGASPPPAPQQVKVGQTPAQPSRSSRPTQHAVPIAIEVVSPVIKAEFQIEPGKHPKPDPSMPTLDLHAKVVFQGKPVSTGTLTWEFTISGKYRVRAPAEKGSYRWQQYKFSAGSARTSPGEQKKFQLAPGELVGGDLEVKVTYDGGPELGGLKATATVTAMKVVGKNPARADVEALVAELAGDQTWCMIRMFCHESVHSLGQFKKGQPLYGPPSGVGIVQRDPVDTEWQWPQSRLTQPNNFFPRIFWDWKKNVREGVETFRSSYLATARRILGKLRKKNPNLPAPSEEVLLRSAIRHYNGGTEYAVSSDGKHYVVSPKAPPDRLAYVNEVLNDPHVDAKKYPIPADTKAERWP